jgi:predicted small lipoprotein YifL
LARPVSLRHRLLPVVVALAAGAMLSGCGRKALPEVPKAEQPAEANPLIGFGTPAPVQKKTEKPKRDFFLDPLL